MTDHDRWHPDMARPVSEDEFADPLVDAIRRDLDRPRGAVTGPGISDRPRVICWAQLSVDDTEAALRRLADWVEWLVARYSLDHRTIPPCWNQHGALVEELSALHSLWQACFGHDASPADPASFHQHLSLAVVRLRDWAARRDCKPGHHRDDQPPVWPDQAQAADDNAGARDPSHPTGSRR